MHALHAFGTGNGWKHCNRDDGQVDDGLENLSQEQGCRDGDGKEDGKAKNRTFIPGVNPTIMSIRPLLRAVEQDLPAVHGLALLDFTLGPDPALQRDLSDDGRFNPAVGQPRALTPRSP